MSDKTEEPTPQRLRKAQEEGDRGISHALAQAVGFVLVLALLPAWGAAAFEQSAQAVKDALAIAAERSPRATVDTIALGRDVLVLTLPLLLVAGIGAAAASVAQGGGPLAWKKLTPKASNLDVVRGLRNLWSGARAFSVVRSLALMLVTLWLGVKLLRLHTADLAGLAARPDRALPLLGSALLPFFAKVGALGLVFGLLDLVVVRRGWKKRLRMSKDEVKREHRENDGDPEIKAARERAHREVMAQINVAAVKTAHVIVINPTHLACALRYDVDGRDGRDGDEAPVLVAFGEGDLAARLLEAARVYGVPVLRNITVARALKDLEIGDAIPEALYEAVAEILKEVEMEKIQ